MIQLFTTADGNLVPSMMRNGAGAGARAPASVAEPAWLGYFPHQPAAALWQLLADDAAAGSPSLEFWADFARAVLRQLLLGYGSTSASFGPCSRGSVVLPSKVLGQLVTRASTQDKASWGKGITTELLTDWAQRLRAELVRGGARGSDSGDEQDLLISLKTRWPQLYRQWQHVGQLWFHLGETGKQHEGKPPFGFLATVISGISPAGKPQHMALAKLVKAGSRQPGFAPIMALVEGLATQEPFWRQFHQARPLWQPQFLTAEQAYHLLGTADSLADLDIALKLPDSWRGRKPAKVQLNIQVTAEADDQEARGASWLRFSPRLLRPDGQMVEELSQLPEHDGLVRLKGRWVSVSRTRLEELRDSWQQLMTIQGQGIPLTTALSWLARWSTHPDQTLGLSSSVEDSDQQDVVVDLGPKLVPILRPLLEPSAAALTAADRSILARSFKATLRPYQQAGVAWLRQLYHHGLGGILADDMGLGKTVQMLAFITLLRGQEASTPILLVVPTTLLANWQREAAKFAPGLRLAIHHPSFGVWSPAQAVDMVITSYGMVKNRLQLREPEWQAVVLDEAQAIKNPATAVHQAIQQLKGGPKILLTGTPLENSLADLWALLDTCARPLLGSWPEFRERLPELSRDATPLKTVIKPFVLRRMKSDRSIIKDLPPKLHRRVPCPMTEEQVDLYKTVLKDWQKSLAAKQADSPDGGDMGRQGAQSDTNDRNNKQDERAHILTMLLHLRQICNHPSHYLKDESYGAAASGKFHQLARLARVVAAQGEKMLVFTAYRELTSPLERLLSGVFGRRGLVLHGGNSAAERGAMVEEFQQPGGPPFFVLSLRAGGTGLTLTAASHVVHFDRWWNPAIENQATDRAYRIGQTRRVVVHQFICQGTVEDRLAQLLADKQQLAEEVVDGSQQGLAGLRALSDAELLAAFQLGTIVEAAGAETAGDEDQPPDQPYWQDSANRTSL